MDRIILRRDTERREIIAFLPDAECIPGKIECYAHIGQHNEASLEYYRQKTVPVRELDHPDVQAMMRELRAIGYNPRIIKRR